MNPTMASLWSMPMAARISRPGLDAVVAIRISQ
jgi:hypothetical protein